jgi:hypothetical protein
MMQANASTRYSYRVLIARAVAVDSTNTDGGLSRNCYKSGRATPGQLHSRFVSRSGSSLGSYTRRDGSSYLASIVRAAYIPLGEYQHDQVLPREAAASIDVLWRAVPTDLDASGAMVLLEPAYLAFRRAVARLVVPSLGQSADPSGVAGVLASQEWAADVARFGRLLARPQSSSARVNAELKHVRARAERSSRGAALHSSAERDRAPLGAPVSPVAAGGYHVSPRSTAAEVEWPSSGSLGSSAASARAAASANATASVITRVSIITDGATVNGPKAEPCLDFWGFSGGLCSLSEQITGRYAGSVF